MQEEKTEIERCDFIHVHEDVVKKVKEHIPAERELNDLAEFFKVFGDVTRLKLLSVLFHSEDARARSGKDAEYDSVGDLSSAPHFETDEAREKQKGEGKTVFYSLADGEIKTIINQGMEHIQE